MTQNLLRVAGIQRTGITITMVMFFFEDALANSWNLAAIHTLNSVLKKVGNNQVVSFLKGLGYNMDDEDFNLNYAIGGWKYGTTPTMQAAAYAAISNGGTYIKPHTIQKIVINTTGETINVDDDIQKQASEGMKDSTAFLTSSGYDKAM